MNTLLTLSGTRLAHLIRTREITSLEVVEAHIDHIRRVNPVINAVVQDRFRQARFEARQADEKTLASSPEDLPPFHGVPCTIKECFAVAGMPNTSGLRSRAGTIAFEDAPTVARLKQAGAIPLGVTNTSELCMWYETSNTVYGRTNNPYNPKHMVGGSSGGEGAIVGAGGSPFGLAADIGGSIRMPAFFNGVFGHKPSPGLVPNTGQFPIAHGAALRYLASGPISRRAEDLMPLLRVLAGPDGKDPECQQMPLGDPGAVDLAKLTVIDAEVSPGMRVTPDLEASQRRAVAALTRRGATVRQVRFDWLGSALEVWSAMLAEAGGPSFCELMGGGTPVNAFGQLLRYTVGRSPHTLPAIALGLAEALPKYMPKRAKQALELGGRLREELHGLLTPGTVMLFPSHRNPALEHNKPLLRPFSFVYTAIFNVMELPATQIPMGLNAQGLPVGIQAVVGHGQDHVSIAVGMALEEAYGGWEPPDLGR